MSKYQVYEPCEDIESELHEQKKTYFIDEQDSIRVISDERDELDWKI